MPSFSNILQTVVLPLPIPPVIPALSIGWCTCAFLFMRIYLEFLRAGRNTEYSFARSLTAEEYNSLKPKINHAIAGTNDTCFFFPGIYSVPPCETYFNSFIKCPQHQKVTEDERAISSLYKTKRRRYILYPAPFMCNFI